MWRYPISIMIMVAIVASYTPSWATVKEVLPTGLIMGFDIARLPYYLWKEKTGGQYEFHGSMDFKKILLDIDYGFGEILRKEKALSKDPPRKPLVPPVKIISHHLGQYVRIGLSYNFLPIYREHNAAFLGLAYSISIFRDALYGNVMNVNRSSVPDEHDIDVDKTDKFNARWLEVVAGVRLQPWQWGYIGCTIRYKFFKGVSHSSKKLVPFDIIGWGLNETDDAWGVHYYIGIRIPFRSSGIQQVPI